MSTPRTVARIDSAERAMMKSVMGTHTRWIHVGNIAEHRLVTVSNTKACRATHRAQLPLPVPMSKICWKVTFSTVSDIHRQGYAHLGWLRDGGMMVGVLSVVI